MFSEKEQFFKVFWQVQMWNIHYSNVIIRVGCGVTTCISCISKITSKTWYIYWFLARKHIRWDHLANQKNLPWGRFSKDLLFAYSVLLKVKWKELYWEWRWQGNCKNGLERVEKKKREGRGRKERRNRVHSHSFYAPFGERFPF